MLDVTRIIFPRRAGDALFGDAEPANAEARAILACLGQIGEDEPDVAEYHPPFDVVHTPSAIEIVAVAGQKRPAGCRHADAFHLAERTFGRFACAVRVDGAVDAARARAVLR